MLVGEPGPRRLPFAFHAAGAAGRLVLSDVPVGGVGDRLLVERLELELADVGDPADLGDPTRVAERFQRRRTRLRSLAVRVTPTALDAAVSRLRRSLEAADAGVQLENRRGIGFRLCAKT